MDLSSLQKNIIEDLMSMDICIHTSIFDIGATGGLKEGPLSVLNDAQKIKLVSFEASNSNSNPSFTNWFQENCNKIHDLKHIEIPYLAGTTNGNVMFKLTKEPRCSSVIPPNIKKLSRYHNTDRFEVTDQLWLPMTTIDNVVSHLKYLPVIIKSDAQGYDLNVLESALTTIKLYRPWILVEMNCMDYYNNQSTFGSISSFLESHDYYVANLYPAYHYLIKPGEGPRVVNFVDALWIPRNDSYEGNLSEAIKDLICEVAFGICFSNKTIEILKVIERLDLLDKIKAMGSMLVNSNLSFNDHKP